MCEVQIQKGLGLLLPYQDRELSGLASVFTEQLGEIMWGSDTHFFPMGSCLQLLFSLP